MNIIKTAIEGLVIIEPRLFKDDRGYFFESFSQKEFNEKVTPVTFVQDNESQSCYGVIRGLHFQKPPYTQSKLVRVIKGCVLDVAVDIRKNSPTFGQHVAVELTGENHLQFFIPKGFAHGFAVLSEEAVFQYVTQNCYYEIYLMQGTVFLLLDTMIHNRLLFFILAIVSTIISSLGMHWINKRIMRVLKI